MPSKNELWRMLRSWQKEALESRETIRELKDIDRIRSEQCESLGQERDGLLRKVALLEQILEE